MIKHPVEECLPRRRIKFMTPLHYASSNGHAEIIRSLRQKIDFQLINQSWIKESLIQAIKNGHLGCVKALLENQTTDFKKNLTNKGNKKLFFRKVMRHDMNFRDYVQYHYYSIMKNQNHYKLVKYLSQELEFKLSSAKVLRIPPENNKELPVSPSILYLYGVIQLLRSNPMLRRGL